MTDEVSSVSFPHYPMGYYFLTTIKSAQLVSIANCMLQVTFTEEHVSFLHFLTNVCAIVGGNIVAAFLLCFG